MISDIEFQLNIAWVWAISCFEREAQSKKLKTEKVDHKTLKEQIKKDYQKKLGFLVTFSRKG